VAQLWRYPVKSMQGERLDALDVGADSIPGDRAWAVRDSQTGTVLTGRTARPLLHAAARLDGGGVEIALPDGRRLRDGDAETDLALSSFVGHPVHLARADAGEIGTVEAPIDFADDTSRAVQWTSLPGTFNDGHPVHVLTDASLRGASALHPEGEWDVRRFRPNVLIEAAGDDFPEDGWGTVRLGDVALDVYKRTTRCAMTARSQPGLDDDLGVPRTLARNRKAQIGVYARVTRSGTIATGDGVAVT
jgi:uncharacterized protein YcbX